MIEMASLAEYRERLTDSGRRVFNYAVDETRRRNQNYVSPSHILNGLAQTDSILLDGVLHSLGVNPTSVRVAIGRLLDATPVQGELTFPPETANLFMRARGRARSRRNVEKIDSTDFLAMFGDAKRGGELIEILAEYGISPHAVEEAVRDMADKSEPE
jgi:ATP-dependent Clp protease ATP-binding subunit ClpA